MTRNNRLLLGFAVIVLVPVIVVWCTVWPILRGWDLPHIVSGVEQKPVERSLTTEEVQQFDRWIQAHRTGWGMRGETPPAHVDYVVSFKGEHGEDVIVSLWHFRHGDDVAGIQTHQNGPYRMRSFPSGELVPLIQHQVPEPS